MAKESSPRDQNLSGQLSSWGIPSRDARVAVRVATEMALDRANDKSRRLTPFTRLNSAEMIDHDVFLNTLSCLQRTLHSS
jgi:hypothetical protein